MMHDRDLILWGEARRRYRMQNRLEGSKHSGQNAVVKVNLWAKGPLFKW